MFENLNPLDRSTAWLEIFLLMLGAFLIGYFLARYFYKRKFSNQIDELEREKNKWKTISMENPNSNINEGLRVVKTRERTGQLAKPEPTLEIELDSQSIEIPELNFDSFGKASEKDKDDLKKISGIGPFIEKKLNGIGIYTFEQISKFSKKDIDDVTNLIEFFPGRIERDKWTDQAKDLM